MKKKKSSVFTILTIVFSIIFVWTTAFCINTVLQGVKKYIYSESSFLYSIEGEDYARLVDITYQNQMNGADPTDTIEECYAAAKYFEHASYYKAYRENGDEKKAAELWNKMEEQKGLMGELSYMTDYVLAYLDIQ